MCKSSELCYPLFIIWCKKLNSHERKCQSQHHRHFFFGRGLSSPKPHAYIYIYIYMAQKRFLVHFCESNHLFLALRHSHTHPNDLLIWSLSAFCEIVYFFAFLGMIKELLVWCNNFTCPILSVDHYVLCILSYIQT